MCWNPLDEIRLGTDHEVGDVQNLATLIVDPDGKGLESHWQKTAQSLLVGVMLHLLYKAKNEGKPATLPAVDAMLSDPNRSSADLWDEMIDYRHTDEGNHPAVGAAARDMIDRPEEEAGSVLSTAKSHLSLYRDPVVAANVSQSEFKINQLKGRETGYGHDESITSNCHVQNAYPPNRVETADHLSKLTGQTTIVKEQITTSGRRTSALLGQVSRTFQEVQRPLLTPDECLRMPGPKKDANGGIREPGDMVVYVAGYPAIYGRQPLYFQDPVFQARAAVPAPQKSDRLTAKTVKKPPVTITLDWKN